MRFARRIRPALVPLLIWLVLVAGGTAVLFWQQYDSRQALAQRFTLDGITDAITTPMLILDPEDEQFFPGQSQELHDLLPGEKEIVRFTREQGANFHCQPLARGLTGHVMGDFLAAHLGRVR